MPDEQPGPPPPPPPPPLPPPIPDINGILNFAVIAKQPPDILPPAFARQISKIIKNLQAAYDASNPTSTIAAFYAHLVNFNNPHDVISAQVTGGNNTDHLLQTLFATYIEQTTDATPMTFPQFVSRMMTLVIAATSLTDSGQAGYAITAILMNSAYTTHNESLTAHANIQSELIPDIIVPKPVFAIDPSSSASDVYLYENGSLQFVQQADAALGGYITALSFAIGAPISLPTTVGASYTSTLDLTSLLPITNGTIALQFYVGIGDADPLNILALGQSSTGDGLMLSHPSLPETSGTAATGTIVFTVDGASTTLTTGTLLQATVNGQVLQYQLTEDVAVSGVETVFGTVAAVTAGAVYNIGSDVPLTLVVPVGGIPNIYTYTEIQGGIDPVPINESDSIDLNFMYQGLPYPTIVVPGNDGYYYLAITYTPTTMTILWYYNGAFQSQTIAFTNLFFKFNQLSSGVPVDITGDAYLQSIVCYPAVLTQDQLSVAFGLS